MGRPCNFYFITMTGVGNAAQSRGQFMLRNKNLRALEAIADSEVASAIRYLDPDSGCPEETSPVLACVIALTVTIVGALAYIWLYRRL